MAREVDGSTERQADAVRSIARMLLDEQLEDLTTRALALLERSEPAYAGKTMDPVVKRAGMKRTLELALSRLAGGAIPPEVSRATEDVGKERAEQGFPLTALMHSFQLDLRTLWEAVMSEGRKRGLSADPEFLDGLLLVWEATDANSVEVVDAYRRTERDLASHRIEVRGRAFERLVLEGEQEPSIVDEASAILGIPIDASLMAIVAAGVPTRDRELTRCRDALQRAGVPFHFGYMGDELLGIVNRGKLDRETVNALLKPLARWRCGVAEVQGLAQTPQGVRLARAAIRGDTEPGVRPIEAHWIGAIMSGNEELTGIMAREVLAPLMKLRERDGVFETLASYLALGSIAEVAEQTYRHRNTVRSRLQTVEQATGIDLSRPSETAPLVMAMAWLKSSAGHAYEIGSPLASGRKSTRGRRGL